MVTLEIKIQQAFREILIEETWKHLKTNNNFDKVLSIASLIDKYDPGQIHAMKTVEVCVSAVTMATHFLLTGEIVQISEKKNHLV